MLVGRVASNGNIWWLARVDGGSGGESGWWATELLLTSCWSKGYIDKFHLGKLISNSKTNADTRIRSLPVTLSVLCCKIQDGKGCKDDISHYLQLNHLT